MSHEQTKPSPDNQRRFARHAVRGQAKLDPLNEDTGLTATVRATIHDVGYTGAMLLVDQPLEQGSTWRLRFVDSGNQIGATPMVVRYCRRAGNQYQIGAQFMLDPFILDQLGVLKHEMVIDDLQMEGRFSSVEFSAPEAVDA